MLFGVVCWIWHSSELWTRVHAFAPLFAIALIAGGAGMLYRRSAPAAAWIVGAAFAILALASTADAIAAPSNYGSYVDFFELLSVVCGAASLVAGRAIVQRTARAVFGVCVVSFALAQIAFLAYTASLVPAWMPPNQIFWTNLTTGAFGLAAIAILIGRKATLALRLLALMIGLFGIIVWLPKMIVTPQTLSNWSEFGLNDLIAASALLLAQVHSRSK